MKKLFFYNIEVKVTGYYYSLLKRKKFIKAITYLEGNTICDEDLKDSTIIDLVKEYKAELKQRIKLRNYINILDYSDALLNLKHFKEISDLTLVNCNLKEATVEQAIKTLTVSEFADIYGNILKIER